MSSGCRFFPGPRNRFMNSSIVGRRAVAIVITSLVLALGLIGGSACGGSKSDSEATTNSANPEIRLAQLEISGMTCHGCASGVQDTLKSLPGVIDAVVSREDKTARVTLKGGSVTGEPELRAAVDAKGYKVTDCTWDS